MEKILRILEKNAFLTNAQLAAMLGESEEKIAAAHAAYEKDGTICGYQALINWNKLETEYLEAFIEVCITPKAALGFEGVAEMIAGFDEVESVYLISGGYDLMVTVAGRSFHEVAMFVSKRLAPMESVTSTSTHFVLRRYKKDGVLLTLPDEGDERSDLPLC